MKSRSCLQAMVSECYRGEPCLGLISELYFNLGEQAKALRDQTTSRSIALPAAKNSIADELGER